MNIISLEDNKPMFVLVRETTIKETWKKGDVITGGDRIFRDVKTYTTKEGKALLRGSGYSYKEAIRKGIIVPGIHILPLVFSSEYWASNYREELHISYVNGFIGMHSPSYPGIDPHTLRIWEAGDLLANVVMDKLSGKAKHDRIIDTLKEYVDGVKPFSYRF